MSFRRQTRFSTYDSPETRGESNQITIANGVDKRLQLVVTKLPKWGPKGVTVDILTNTLNKLVNVNFATSHIKYALKWLVDNHVIGKRMHGETATYYAYLSTPIRFSAALRKHRK